MRTVKFTYWQDGKLFIGFLNEYPDYQTQGMHKEELAENLKDLLNDLESEHVPYVRKVEELMIAYQHQGALRVQVFLDPKCDVSFACAAQAMMSWPRSALCSPCTTAALAST